MGLPVLANDHYGVEESLAPEFGRRVSYRYGAASALAGALAELLPDRERLKRMGLAAAKAAASMRFSDTAQRLLERALAILSA